jgi:hypothetical protein
MLYLIDLDRTIFDTNTFSRDLLTSLVTHFRIDPKEFRRQMPQYILPTEVGYDFFAHAQAVTGHDIATITQLVTPHLTRTDYAYPDIAPWLEQHQADTIIVVTVGTPAYQGLKFRYCPAISSLQKVVVGENKGKLIRQARTGKPSPFNLPTTDPFTVIDDNPCTFVELGILPELNGVYVSRNGEKYSNQTVPPLIRTITSFGDLL